MIPKELDTIAGTWGAVYDSGDLTYLNLVHLLGFDGTDPDDLTRGEMQGRDQAMMAIEALKQYTPGCEGAKIRNFGMTLGIRDTRKIDAAYNMTEHDVREQGRFEGQHRDFPRVHRWLWHFDPAHHRSLLSTALPDPITQRRAQSDLCRPDYRRRSGKSCCHPQYDVLHGHRSGRRRAAALAVKQDCTFEEVSVAALQQALIAQGVRLH